jgi:hypothetical protein
MDPTPITAADRQAYYRAALAALRFVETRKPTGRRFGADADARWGAFRGELKTADRLDLLLRDADAEWPGAFAARTAFGLRAVAEDDPFGPGWEPLDPVDAEDLWRAALAAPLPATLEQVLLASAAAWGVTIRPTFVEKAVTPTERLVVCGPGAVMEVARLFAVERDLDLAEQVVCVATPPGHRQIAAQAGALLQSPRPVAVLCAEEAPAASPSGRRLIVSPDAAPADAAWAQRLIGEAR